MSRKKVLSFLLAIAFLLPLQKNHLLTYENQSVIEYQNVLVCLFVLTNVSAPVKLGFGRTKDNKEFVWIIGKSKIDNHDTFFSADFISKNLQRKNFLSEYLSGNGELVNVVYAGNSSSEEIIRYFEKEKGWKIWQ